MNSNLFIKISELTNLSDARYCAGMGVNVLGFDLSEKKGISLDEYREITKWVSGIPYLIEFGNCNKDYMTHVINQLHPDFIEVSSMDLVDNLNFSLEKIFFKLHINTQKDLMDLEKNIAFLAKKLIKKITITSCYKALYSTLEKKMLNNKKKDILLIKGFDILADDDGFKKYRAIELKGTQEAETGNKDYGVLMDVLELINE